MANSLRRLRRLFGDAFDELVRRPESIGKGSSIPLLRDIDEELDRLTTLLLEDLYSGERSTRNTTLMLGIALGMRDLKLELERASAW